MERSKMDLAGSQASNSCRYFGAKLRYVKQNVLSSALLSEGSLVFSLTAGAF